MPQPHPDAGAGPARETVLPESLSSAVREAAAAVRRRWPRVPTAGLILGTGLGRLARQIAPEQTIDYQQLPHFPRSTALSHRGRLVCGMLAGQPIVAMQGRCHRYEGYAFAQLALPVYVLHQLGAGVLFQSNASGGLNPRFAPGDVMLIDDHIDLMFCRRHPGLAGKAVSLPGRGIHRPYDPQLIGAAEAAARRQGFAVQRGVYVAVAGPNYETRAECRFLRRIGADAVGMSTVPEALAAQACGMRTLALSIVTNVARPDRPQVVRAESVVAAAEAAEAKVLALITACLADLPRHGPHD